MERPPKIYFCNKCWYVGISDTHPGCQYLAYPMANPEQLYIDHLEAELAALRASPASVPEGWKIVPVEPTGEMVDAGIRSLGTADKFRAMLAAAPTPSSHASAPEGFKHDIGADRFTVVHGSYWWHVRAGEGTQNIGKFHTKRAAEEMALTLLTAFRDGAFMQYQAMLIAAPTTPVSEDQKDAERLHAILETLKMEFYIAEIDAHHPEVHAIRKLRTSLFAKLTEILKAPAMQEDKP